MSTSIIDLTPRAATHIQQMIARQPNAVGFRLSIKKSGCSGYAYSPQVVDKAVDGDLCYELQGLKVYVDRSCMDLIKGTVIDLVDKGLGQRQLLFRNPNEKGSCGCGESISF